MGATKYLNSESMLNASGILVTLFVGSLSIYTVWDTSALAVVAFLLISQLFCFGLFLALDTSNRSGLLALFWIEAILIFSLHFLVNNSFIAILSIILIVQAAELFGSRRSSWMLVACLTVLIISQRYHLGEGRILDTLFTAISFGLFMVFALSAILRAINERKLREETRALNRELIATRELLSQSAAQGERVRIARDLHDILGHHMTALILNLEVAKHKVEGEAEEKVELSLAIAKLLLGDLRTAVGELRDDDVIDLEQSITKLIAGIPQVEIEVDFSNAPAIRDVGLAETLLRCTQEAITNVLRHSHASNCRIELRAEKNLCVLTVVDNGQPSLASSSTKKKEDITPGNGLKGMKERISASGGNLSWRQTEDGFQLRAELAMDAEQ